MTTSSMSGLCRNAVTWAGASSPELVDANCDPAEGHVADHASDAAGFLPHTVDGRNPANAAYKGHAFGLYGLHDGLSGT